MYSHSRCMWAVRSFHDVVCVCFCTCLDTVPNVGPNISLGNVLESDNYIIYKANGS